MKVKSGTVLVVLVSVCALLSPLIALSRDLTVFVTSDAHLTAPPMDADQETRYNNTRVNVHAMNGLPGLAYPVVVGGTVNTPTGVLVLGDLTTEGLQPDWEIWESFYPLNGGPGLDEINYPVQECSGNHDRLGPVLTGIEARHGSLVRSWDWDGVHFVCLDLYPSTNNSDWLAADLAGLADTNQPVVIVSHFGYYDEAHITNDWAGGLAEAAYFKSVVDGYYVVALIHGHRHDSFRYTWEGYDVYSSGSPASSGSYRNSFGVLNIKDSTLTWSEYHWDKDTDGDYAGGYWEWTHTKAIIPAPVPEPATLLLISLAGLMLLRRRRSQP